MDVALIVNLLLFAATAAATVIAWRQARGARQAQINAEASQRQALAAQRAATAAQKQAADALAEASRTAQHALNLEARRDLRAGEFRDVAWRGDWEEAGDDYVFRVHNVGLTVADDVRLVVWKPDQDRISGLLGTIEPGNYADLPAGGMPEGLDAIDILLFTDSPFKVHWVSPLGQADEYTYQPLEQD